MDTVESLQPLLGKVYVGPGFPTVGLNRYDRYSEQFPEHVVPLINQYPILKDLFIDLDELPSHNKDLAPQGSRLQQIYAQVSQLTKPVGRKLTRVGLVNRPGFPQQVRQTR
jgi:hypothetical protein